MVKLIKKRIEMKNISRYILLYIIMVVVFSVSIILAFALPNEMIQEHIKDSLIQLKIEDRF